MIEMVKTYPLIICLYKRLEFTEHVRRGWKGWKIITILSNNRAKRLGKHHQFNIFWLVFVFHCSDNPDHPKMYFQTKFQHHSARNNCRSLVFVRHDLMFDRQDLFSDGHSVWQLFQI